MERKYLLIGHFTSICSTTCNNYSLLKCNRDYLILNVIIFSKKGVMIVKKNLIEAGKYMNIRGKKLYVETHGNPKISQSYTCMVDQEKVVMIFHFINRNV